MDSFGGSQYGVTSNLRDYLVQEAKEKYGYDVQQTSIGMTAKNLPQQHNGCDCGLFLLGYVQSFLKNPDALMHGLMQKIDVEQLQPFFVDMDASKLRDQIRRLLFELAREQAVREHNEKIAKRTAKQAAKQANTRQTALPSSSPIQMSSQPQLSQGPPEQAADRVQKVPVISESSPYTAPKVNTGTEAVVADADGPTPEDVGLDANANQRGSPILGDDVNDTKVTAQSPAAVATKPVVSDLVVENKAQWIASENLGKHHASLSNPELMPAIEDLVEDMLFEEQRPEGAAEVVVQSTLSSAILPEKRKEEPVESRRLGSPFEASPARKTHVEVVVETPVKKSVQGPAPRQTAHDNDIQEAALPSRTLASAKKRRENPYHVQATVDEDEVKEVQPPSNTVSAIKTRNVTPYHGGVQKRTTISVDDADRRPDHDSIALALEKKHTAVLVVDEEYERLSQDSLVQAMPQEHRPRNTQRTEIPDSQEHEVHPDDRQERQPSFTSLLSDDEDEPVPVDAPVEPIKHSFMGSGTRRNKTGAAAASSSRVATTIGGGTHMHFSSPTRTSPRALSRKSVVSSQQTRVSPPSPRSGRDSPARSRVTSPRLATRSSPRQPGRSSMTVVHRSDGKKSGGSDKESAIELD
jgi:sentrin-specific protease 7